jgi:sugar phosphate isomerase/epimerase
MKKMKIALQVYSVRDEAAKDFLGTLKQIKEMGYDGVELAGLYGMSAAEVRAALDEVGLPAISAHVPYDELVENAYDTVAAYKQIGCEYIAIPYLQDNLRPGTDAFPHVIEEIARIGKVCKEQGIQLLYHNHEFEFAPMDDGSYALDYMYAKVPEDLLQTEIDTCWVNYAREDPAAYVRKYTGRAPVVHLKDFFTVGSKGWNQPREGFEFRPVGHGTQDMPAILEASSDAGADWVVVEQDMSPQRPPMRAAQMSIDYLRSEGL